MKLYNNETKEELSKIDSSIDYEHWLVPYRVWNNIVMIALCNDINLPKTIAETTYLIKNDKRMCDNCTDFNKTLIIFSILADKLGCHISDLFNMDEVWIRTRLYKLLQKYKDMDLHAGFCGWSIEDYDGHCFGDYIIKYSRSLPGLKGTCGIGKRKDNESHKYTYIFEYSLLAETTITFAIEGEVTDFYDISNKICGLSEIYSEEDGQLKEYFDAINNKDYQFNVKLNVKDFVVRTSAFNCRHKEHRIVNIEAEFLIATEDNTRQSVKVPAGYCSQCNVYFIMESTYQKLKEKGMLLCRVCDEKTYRTNKSTNNMNLAQESILRQYGYNVGQEDGLSEISRRKILAIVIDNRVLSKTEIIGYLDFFISQHTDSKYKTAISKWESDRDFVETYKIGEYTKYNVNRLIRK